MSKELKQEVAIRYITENYLDSERLRKDIVSNKVQMLDEMPTSKEPKPYWRNIADADINDMVCACVQESGVGVTAREMQTVLNSHHVPHVHPLRDYVMRCHEQFPYAPNHPDWIDWLASKVTVEDDQAYWRECFKKWFVAMVASWMRDDKVNQQVLVLLGPQGIFKTTWLDYLLPPELRDYGCKMANASTLNKDERLRIAEYALINLDEIDAMTPKELNVMKSVITAASVNERAAYALTKENKPRLASFCASGNKTEFLTDATGNRRFLPFKVVSIEDPFITLIPYEQIYAQAYWHFINGFQYWFVHEDIAALEVHNEDFRAQENEEQLIDVYFDHPTEDDAEWLRTAEVSDLLVTKGGIKRPMPLSRLGMFMRKAGFEEKRNKNGRGWLVRRRSDIEIADLRKQLAKE